MGDNMIGSIIKGFVKKKGGTIHGARAMNKQLAFGFLERGTRDYDIYMHAPKRSAIELRDLLQKKTGSKFSVIPAEHKGTFKVQRDEETVADITTPRKGLKIVNIDGIKYAHVSERVSDAERTLQDPSHAFRHTKDRMDIDRVKKSQLFRRRMI